MNYIKTTLLATTLVTTSPLVVSGVINFDNYTAGTIIDDEYSLSNGVTFNGINVARNADNLAVIFYPKIKIACGHFKTGDEQYLLIANIQI